MKNEKFSREGGEEGGGNVASLVRGELAAISTYKQALEKVGEDEQARAELSRIESEHEEASALLQQRMAGKGVKPPSDPGVWGAWAQAIEGAAKLLGNKAAIKALKEGEEHGIKEYEEALEDTELDSGIKELISSELLPKTRAHIPVLDRFLDGKSGQAGESEASGGSRMSGQKGSQARRGFRSTEEDVSRLEQEGGTPKRGFSQSAEEPDVEEDIPEVGSSRARSEEGGRKPEEEEENYGSE